MLTPLEVVSARLPPAFALFAGKIAKLDKKLTLTPETVLLIREQVGNQRLSLLARGHRPLDGDSSDDERGRVLNCADDYRASPLFSDAERAVLDYATELTKEKKVERATFERPARHYSDCHILRNRLAHCQRAFLQHHQHRPEHSFGHALRHSQKEQVKHAAAAVIWKICRDNCGRGCLLLLQKTSSAHCSRPKAPAMKPHAKHLS